MDFGDEEWPLPAPAVAALARVAGDPDMAEYLQGVVRDWTRETAQLDAAALAETLAEFCEGSDPAAVADACGEVVAALRTVPAVQAQLGAAAVPAGPVKLDQPVASLASDLGMESSGGVGSTVPAAAAAAAAGEPAPAPGDDGERAPDGDEAWAQRLDDTDDFATAWAECRASGRAWGGRGFGGRGVARRYQATSTATRDVLVDNVTMSWGGRELLAPTTLRLVHGHRYVLLGQNGVGKSTLLRRIALVCKQRKKKKKQKKREERREERE